MRSGKLNRPITSDISIEWLIEAYNSLLKERGKNLHVIPVAINYERLFEIKNLASEMIGGDDKDASMISIKQMIGS